MAEQDKTVVQTPATISPPPQSKTSDKKAPAPGTDQRPQAPVQHQDLTDTPQPSKVYDAVPKGQLGDGGPTSDQSGKNKGNMHEEKEQHPSLNATAGGPDVGRTPANAPGMSHS